MLDIFVIIYLNNLFIYINDLGQSHINTVWWVFEKLRKNSLFANLKKCQFHKVKVRFLKYIMSV